MDRRTLGLLAIGVVLLMILVGFVGSVLGGLPSQTVALVEAELQNFERDAATFSAEKETVEAALASEPELFTATEYQQGWRDRLDEAQKRLDAAESDLAEVRALREANESASVGKIDELLTRTRAARVFAANEATEMSSVASLRVGFKQNLDQKIRELAAAHEAVAGTNFSAARNRIEQASMDWPGKKSDLQKRLSAVSEMVDGANQAWQTIETENAKRGSGGSVTYDQIIPAAQSLTDYGKTVPASLDQITVLVSQLYRSWDRILVDMEIREGTDVTFHHKIKTVDVSIKDVANKTNETSEREEWKQISESEYKAMGKNLGMTVERKSAGKYDHEAEKIAQPAGFAYMCPPGERQNQYGYWQTSSGGSFWVFYGQYAMMRSLFWGPGYYRPIYYNHYNNYNTAYRSGRSYYGTSSAGRQRYGTSGTFTSSRYANSSYKRTGGFKNSQYVRSGGSYRGSRFESRPGSSRGSFGRSSARQSGSRFGRGK